MKTLIIYNQLEDDILYFVLEGDFTRYHGVTINSESGNGFEAEFCDLVYDNEGKFRLNFSSDKTIVEDKNWDKVAVVTWLP